MTGTVTCCRRSYSKWQPSRNNALPASPLTTALASGFQLSQQVQPKEQKHFWLSNAARRNTSDILSYRTANSNSNLDSRWPFYFRESFRIFCQGDMQSHHEECGRCLSFDSSEMSFGNFSDSRWQRLQRALLTFQRVPGEKDRIQLEREQVQVQDCGIDTTHKNVRSVWWNWKSSGKMWTRVSKSDQCVRTIYATCTLTRSWMVKFTNERRGGGWGVVCPRQL